MTVTSTWTNPSEGGTLDRDSGETIREQDWDALLSNLLFLGGTTGALPRENLLTNPGFEHWQRGNGPYTSTGVYSADRWLTTLTGADTLSISRNSATADTALGSNYCAACTFVLSGGGGATSITQSLKATDLYQVGGREVAVSVRVNTATASAVRVGVHNGSTWTYSSFHTGGSTYQTLSATATIGVGSTAQIGIFFAVSCTAYVDNAMFVLGSSAATYTPLHPDEDIRRCSRYYELLSFVANEAIGTVTGIGTTITSALRIPLGVKAAAPTTTGVGAWNIQIGNGGASGVSSVAFVSTTTQTNLKPTVTAVNGTLYHLFPTATNNVIAEANP